MGNNNSQVGPDVATSALQQLKDLHEQAPPALPQRVQKQQQQSHRPQSHRPLVRRTSSTKRGYHPRSASLRRMRSIQRRRLLEGSSTRQPASKRTAKMEADNKKRQDEKQLLASCARGDLKRVESLVDCGVDVNAADQNQMTALHYASMQARDEVIKSLISRGAEVTTADLKGGFTAMHWVVINAEPQYGSTDHIDKSLSALSRAGCKVNSTDFNFATPLHIAVQKGNKGCVQALMRLGADPLKVDITGRNSFEVAKDDQMKALLKRLHEKYSQKDDIPIYQILEAPAPTMPAPPPPVPPPRLVVAGKSQSEDLHLYSPPTSPRSSSCTPPPPPPRRRRQYSQYCNDSHIYHVLEVPPPKSRGPSPPRLRKGRKH